MVSSTPRPHFTPGKDPVPILQEAGWAPGQVWTCRKSCPHRDSNLDRPARSSVAIPTELPGPQLVHLVSFIIRTYIGARWFKHGIFCRSVPVNVNVQASTDMEPSFVTKQNTNTVHSFPLNCTTIHHAQSAFSMCIIQEKVMEID